MANGRKAEYLAKYLKLPVTHVSLDLEEIQSLSLKEIVEHKARQAFEMVNSPVVVEDVSLEFEALGGLPGPFIRFFVERVPFETLCSMINGQSRRATARCVFGYCDAHCVESFESALGGAIAEIPAGKDGFGWDRIFVPDGYSVTSAQLNETQYQKIYTQIKPLAALKIFLESR